MKKVIVTLFVLFAAAAGTAQAKIVGEAVQYKVGDTTFKGYLAYDNRSKKKRPGILVVHEWWGQNEYARTRARDLAKLGYVALSLDMYGDGKVASHPKEAGAFAGQVKQNMPAAKERFLAARKVLIEHSLTDPNRIGAVGYCFGGGIVLEMARMGVDLDGVVSFHGSLGTANPARKGEVKAKVLVLHGASDPFVKPEQIQAFKKEMSNAGVDYRFIEYPNAKHAFTNPAATENGKKFGIPLEYNKSADRKSWKEMKKFLKKIF
jgi:dienelactone hydrolase